MNKSINNVTMCVGPDMFLPLCESSVQEPTVHLPHAETQLSWEAAAECVIPLSDFLSIRHSIALMLSFVLLPAGMQ